MLLVILLFILFPVCSYAQVGTTVEQVLIRDAHNKPMVIPHLGEKNLLIFYPDPDHSDQNKSISDYLKQNKITSPKIHSFGVVNLKDAPFLPNIIVRRMVRREIKETGNDLFTDVDNSLSRGWNLGEVNNKFCIIFVDTNRKILFFKAGELTETEKEELLTLIKKYS